MRDALLSVPRPERGTLKGKEIARLVSPSSQSIGGLAVELTTIAPIPGGVEVLLKASNARGPVGFGDGTVEVERVRIFNPPILVPDPAGAIVDYSTDPRDGTVHERRLREDGAAALWQVVAHVLSVIRTFGPERVIRGKVGRTVSTFYSGGGDGYLEWEDPNWDTAHDTTTGFLQGTQTTARVGAGQFFGAYSIRRAFLPFDTSAIPDSDVVTAATLSIWPTVVTNGDNDGDDFVVPVGPTTQADPTILADVDYDQCGAVDNPNELSSDRKDISGIGTGAYINWSLNSSGIAAVSKTGYTLLGLREGHDVLDSPYAGGDPASNLVQFSASEETGTTQDPALVVTHTAPTTTTLRFARRLSGYTYR